MTEKTINYETRENYLRGSIQESRNGWRVLHINQGYETIFSDTPSPKVRLENLTQVDFIKRLARLNNVKLV